MSAVDPAGYDAPKPARQPVTRRKRLRLIAWHLRIAWDHLIAIVRGR